MASATKAQGWVHAAGARAGQHAFPARGRVRNPAAHRVTTVSTRNAQARPPSKFRALERTRLHQPGWDASSNGFLCQIHDFLIDSIPKRRARKTLLDVLPGQAPHVCSTRRIGSERLHGLCEGRWTRFHEEARLLVQDGFHRSSAVAGNDGLGSCHCFQGNDAKVFERGRVKDCRAAAEQRVLGRVGHVVQEEDVRFRARFFLHVQQRFVVLHVRVDPRIVSTGHHEARQVFRVHACVPMHPFQRL
mmetsp:Transcript_3905/g.24709  ORF Transcript_3905/g.24709 Transcript_3905/m.24709 type:complete len:246 (+) Transcript_3905:781-1518(+)